MFTMYLHFIEFEFNNLLQSFTFDFIFIMHCVIYILYNIKIISYTYIIDVVL